MPTSIRTYRIVTNAIESLVAIALSVGTFVLVRGSGSDLSHPWLIAVLGLAMSVAGFALLVSETDAPYLTGRAKVGGALCAVGTGLFFGIACATIDEQGKEVEGTVMLISWLTVGLFPIVLLVRRIWADDDERQAIDALPYPMWRRELRRIARDGDASPRIRQMVALRLHMPEDEDAIRAYISSDPAYASYDLTAGWPHQHDFKTEDTSVEDGDGEDVTIVTTRERCSCGTTRTRVVRRKLLGTQNKCPHCGAKDSVSFGDVDIWMGGHFTVDQMYTCSECHYEDYDDFSVEEPVYDEEAVSVTYGQ